MAEVMLAMLFISIAFFGYMSLHIRLMHSGSKLELRQVHREEVGLEVLAQVAEGRQSEIGVPQGDFAGLRRLTATREWEDKNGRQSLAVETYVSRSEWDW